jgi:hypothetical protein
MMSYTDGKHLNRDEIEQVLAANTLLGHPHGRIPERATASTVGDHQREVDDLRRQVKELQAVVAREEAKAKRSAAEIAEEQEEVDQLRKEVKAAQDRLTQLQAGTGMNDAEKARLDAYRDADKAAKEQGRVDETPTVLSTTVKPIPRQTDSPAPGLETPKPVSRLNRIAALIAAHLGRAVNDSQQPAGASAEKPQERASAPGTPNDLHQRIAARVQAHLPARERSTN